MSDERQNVFERLRCAHVGEAGRIVHAPSRVSPRDLTPKRCRPNTRNDATVSFVAETVAPVT